MKGGGNDAGNLTTLCLRCHELVHEGFLVITGTAPHGIAFADREGRPVSGMTSSRESADEPEDDDSSRGTRGPLSRSEPEPTADG